MKKVLLFLLAVVMMGGIFVLYEAEEALKKSRPPEERPVPAPETKIPPPAQESVAEAPPVVEQKKGAPWKALGPFGGNIKALVVDSDGAVFAGTDGGGVFKNVDLGLTWVPVNNGLTQPFITSMAISPEGVLFAGTKEGLYKKERGVEGWSFIESFPRNWVPAIVIAQDGTMYASVWGTGMFMSEDKGATWVDRSEGLTIPFLSALAVGPSGQLLCGSESGVYAYNKEEQSWSHFGLVEEIITSLSFDQEGHVYVGAWGNGVYKHDGQKWDNISRYIGSSFVKSLLLSKSGNIYAGTEVGVYQMQSDYSWMHIGLENKVVLKMVDDAAGNFLAGTDGRGFFVRPAGQEKFEQRNKGITNFNITEITDMEAGEVIGTYFSLFTLSNEGVWKEFDYQIKNIRAFHHLDKDTLLLGSALGIYKGNPFLGETGLKKISGSVGQYSFTSFTAAPDGTIFAASDQDGIYMSRDQGESWEPAANSLPNNVVHVVMTDPKGQVFAGSNSGISRWKADAQEWEDVSGALKDWAVSMIVAHPDGSLYAGVDRQGVYYKANDPAADWAPINEGLANKRMACLKLGGNGVLYAGTQGGLFQWSPETKTWSPIGEGIYNPIIQTLSFDKEGRMLAGTWGGGLFRLEP